MFCIAIVHLHSQWQQIGSQYSVTSGDGNGKRTTTLLRLAKALAL